MTTVQWQTPLVDFVDPTKLPSLAADNGEVEFAANVASASSMSNFVTAYAKILDVISEDAKISQHLVREKLNLTLQLLKKSDGWKNVDANSRIFKSISVYIKSFLSNGGRSNLTSEKRMAWQKCQTHFSAWQGAYSSSPQELIAAIEVDAVLFSQKGPISVEAAIDYVKKHGIAASNILPEIVEWYLTVIRSTHRKDIILEIKQVLCPRCGSKHAEGATCSHCSRAETLLKDAQAALAAKRWPDAIDKANEIFLIWNNCSEANDIIEKARMGEERERKQKEAEEERKRLALEAERKRKAEEEERKRLALEAEQRRRAEEAERKRKERETAIAAAKKRYDDAILYRNWALAEQIAQERSALGDGTIVGWQSDIRACQKKRREMLEDECKKALEKFDGIFSEKPEEAQDILLVVAKNLSALEAEFKDSIVVNTTRKGITTRREKLKKEENNRRIGELHNIEGLKAAGTQDGIPMVTLSWTPAASGTKADKWRVLRRERGNNASRQEKIAEVASPSFIDKDASLKIGVEYEYGILPLVEVEIAPNRKELKANDKMEPVWSSAVVCLIRLPADVLKGKGEGIDKVGGIVSLWWKLPPGIPENIPRKITISRSDGGLGERDVTAKEGHFDDVEVIVGHTYEYRLRVFLNGHDIGTSLHEITVEKVTLPPKVSDFSLRRQGGSLVVRWKWPEGLDACLWGVSECKANSPEELPRTSRRMVSRDIYEREGGVRPIVLPGGRSCWITVFGERAFGEREIFSSGEGFPISETVLNYSIENHPGSLFSKRKPAWLVIHSSTGYIPELEIRAGKNRSEVHSRHGGRLALSTGQETGKNEKRIVLDGVVAPGEFVQLYLVRPEVVNCKLIHPYEFEVK